MGASKTRFFVVYYPPDPVLGKPLFRAYRSIFNKLDVLYMLRKKELEPGAVLWREADGLYYRVDEVCWEESPELVLLECDHDRELVAGGKVLRVERRVNYYRFSETEGERVAVTGRDYGRR